MRRPGRVRSTRYPQRDAEVAGGVRVRYIDVPPGTESEQPPVVLLHGLASRIEEYEELVPVLGARRRVIVLDLPGNGYSDKPDRPYTLTFMEDAVLGLLDHLQIHEAHVAGGSLGGNLTLRLGHREPERFRRLAAWAPAGVWEPKHGLALIGRLLGNRVMFWPMVWIQSRFWYHPRWPGRENALREAFAHFREVHGRAFVRMYFELGREQVLTSLFPIAHQIAQPTLLLWGDQDHGLGMGAGVKRLVKMLPRARLHVFRDARHSLANEVPEALAQEVDTFLAGPELPPRRVAAPEREREAPPAHASIPAPRG